MAKYDYKCENCGLETEMDIPIAEYDKLKDKQECPACQHTPMTRVLSWQGGVTLCAGMYGIDGKKGWTN